MLQDDRQDRRLKIATLGRFQVVREGRLLSGECRRASRVWELFKYLVTNRGRDIPSDTLIENLWEEDQPEDPERALRNLVYRLRQILDPGDAPSPLTSSYPGGFTNSIRRVITGWTQRSLSNQELRRKAYQQQIH